MKAKFPFLLLVVLILPWFIHTTSHPYYVVFLLGGVLFSLLLMLYKHRALQISLLLLSLLVSLRVPEVLLLTPWLYSAMLTEGDWIVPGAYTVTSVLLTIQMLSVENAYLLIVFYAMATALTLAADRLQRNSRRYHNVFNEMQEAKLHLSKALQGTLESKEKEVELAKLAERNRLTRDMHDGLGHVLSRSILQIGAMQAVSKDPERMQLGAIQETLQEAMAGLRSNLHQLREDDLDLERAVRELVDKFTFCQISLSYTIRTPLTLNASYSILAILQEALNNIIRHSEATSVKVKCLETKDKLFITVKDNGPNAAIPSLGIGLQSIRERAASLQGSVEFSTEDGFLVFLILPKEALHATHLD